MKPDLRHYQAKGVSALRGHVDADRKRILLACPTGGGKTVLASFIIQSSQDFGAKVLFVAHRIELIDQTVKQLARWGIINVGVVRADDKRSNPAAPIQVATIQTLRRRKNVPEADIVFIDEAHLAAAISYRNLIDLYPNATIIGLTATPCRADGKPLGAPAGVFEALEIAATYKNLIEDKFIVAPRCFGVPPSVAPKLEGIRTQHGDFVIDELESAMLETDVLGDTVAEYGKHLKGLRTVVFACTVKHSKAILDRFLAAGVRAAHVDANTPHDDRRDISRRLDIGELDVVTNVGVYCEGWDQPCVKGLILARPTKSLVLCRQMAGRVLRPWNLWTSFSRSWLPEDGPSVRPVIIDQGGNIARHGFPHEDIEWSLETETKVPKERKPTQCIKCLAYIPHYPCTECGFAPVVPPREVKEDRSQLLVELDPSFDPRRVFFDRRIEEARNRGYKPAWAFYRFQTEYGEQPPWSWRQGAKEACASDEQWKRRIVNKEADRVRWKSNEDAKPKFDTDEDFAAWARKS